MFAVAQVLRYDGFMRDLGMTPSCANWTSSKGPFHALGARQLKETAVQAETPEVRIHSPH